MFFDFRSFKNNKNILSFEHYETEKREKFLYDVYYYGLYDGLHIDEIYDIYLGNMTYDPQKSEYIIPELIVFEEHTFAIEFNSIQTNIKNLRVFVITNDDIEVDIEDISEILGFINIEEITIKFTFPKESLRLGGFEQLYIILSVKFYTFYREYRNEMKNQEIITDKFIYNNGEFFNK